MTLRQFEFLIGVAEHGSISACAEYYGVSQPAVTNQIHLLEEELGAPLILRGSRGATLTDLGQKIVDQARVVLQDTQRIARMAEESKQTLSGTVVLGVSPLLPVSIRHFPRIYRPFHRAFPDIRIEVVEIEALHLAEQVQSKRVDLALTPLPLFTTKARYEPLWQEELVVISNVDEPLPDTVSLAALRTHPFIFMKPGFSLNLTVARMAQDVGFEPRIVAEASSIHALLSFVAAGMGIAVVPVGTVTLESQAGLVKLSQLSPPAYRRFAMVCQNRDNLAPAVEVFMNYIRSYSDDIPSDDLHQMALSLYATSRKLRHFS
ncbi:MAG: LysR family transcriptional regulator [Sulfobacillus thermotolerans]|nr:LysR family transcriptional regulator [Sulfobacillus thermotolerans]